MDDIGRSRKDLMMSGRSELTRSGGAERIAVEVDLRASAGLVVEIEQEVANRASLDRSDQTGDGVGVGGRNRGDFGGVEIADAAELARAILTGEREHASPRGAFLLEDDQRARGIEEQVQLLGNRRTHAPSTVSLPVRIAAARSRTSAG